MERGEDGVNTRRKESACTQNQKYEPPYAIKECKQYLTGEGQARIRDSSTSLKPTALKPQEEITRYLYDSLKMKTKQNLTILSAAKETKQQELSNTPSGNAL